MQKVAATQQNAFAGRRGAGHNVVNRAADRLFCNPEIPILSCVFFAPYQQIDMPVIAWQQGQKFAFWVLATVQLNRLCRRLIALEGFFQRFRDCERVNLTFSRLNPLLNRSSVSINQSRYTFNSMPVRNRKRIAMRALLLNPFSLRFAVRA